MILAAILFVIVTFLIMMQPWTTAFLVQSSIVLILLAIVGYLAGSCFIIVLLAKMYQVLRRRFDPDYDEIPHEDRLKG